jgi:ribose-phosphate pyrophosphokinase
MTGVYTTLEMIALGNVQPLFTNLCRILNKKGISLEHRNFPDGETYLRIIDDVKGKKIILLTDLSQPDTHTLPAILLSETLREMGAISVSLIAPYLPYMRQDDRFQPGEGMSAGYYARLISKYFDSLITVDPHLHRIPTLDEIFDIPAQVLHAMPLMSEWIQKNIKKPLIIGPDRESAQWVADVAKQIPAPYVVFEKVRKGDISVNVRSKDLSEWSGSTPVLVDDIISSGHTMIESQKHLIEQGFKGTVCVAVHGIFGGEAITKMNAAGLQTLITSNSVPHYTNNLDLAPLLSQTISHGL